MEIAKAKLIGIQIVVKFKKSIKLPMNKFFNDFTNILLERDRSIIVEVLLVSFLNIGIILVCLRILGYSPIEKDKLMRFNNGFERSFLNLF